MHIFSAQAGTKPIYSDCGSEIDKYISIRNQTKKGTLHSLIIAIVIIGLLVLSLAVIKPIRFIILGLLIIDTIIFIFNFMPYLAYTSRVKQIAKYGKCNSKAIDNKSSYTLSGIAAVLWIGIGMWHLHGELYYSAAFFIIFGVYFAFSSTRRFMKYKRCK